MVLAFSLERLEGVMNLQEMSHNLDEILEHQNGKSQKSKASQGFRQAFVITRQTSEAGRPSKAAFHHPTSRQQDEALLGSWQFNHFQTQAFGLRRLGGIFSRVPLIHKGDLHRLSSHLLHLLSQFLHLSSILFIGWGYIQSQQMSQSVHGDVGFAPLFSLGAIVAGAVTTLRRRLQGSAVKNGSRRLFVTTLSQA